MISLVTPVLHAPTAVPVIEPAAASGVFNLLWLLIALPAAGALVLLVGGRRTDRWGHLLGVATVLGSFVIGLILFFTDLGRASDNRAVHQHLWTFFEAGNYRVDFTLLFDQLSALFVLLITGVGFLIHLYSVGYMAHDDRRRRFFGYMNLFVASMLALVLASDYVGLFVGWEGVGLASYLLIGFWQHKPTAAAAAKKAFVVNRVGDIGLSLGVALMFATFGSSSFSVMSAKISEHAPSTATLTAIGLLLLLAACGKSAQFPLQSWLLDAMEGPTPVSALIHAATMVTAGVYLITRSNFIFSLTSDARLGVVIVGTITLLMGAAIGCAKDDIKKALAGSTMSQIGYMILAAGIGLAGYPFAIFHLLTHGFFKANMFLGAGSVMHGTNDDVNMRHYGALRKLMPITFWTFGLGYLAIIGFPGFSGFWSKDKIIEAALTENWLIGLCALLGAGVTGFYMTRLMLMTFFGEKRWEADVHPHESPKVMTVPLMVLGALSAVGGVLLAGDWIVNWLEPVVGHAPEEAPPIPSLAISLIAIVVVACGVALAYVLYGKREVPRVAPVEVSPFTRAARADLYGDLINEELVIRPGSALVDGLLVFDRAIVDGGATGPSTSLGAISRSAVRYVQTGFVRTYALSILLGAAVVLFAMTVVTW